MAYDLSNEEVRVLGALIEKEHTTPDYYPLTLNALVNACNQKSNREPVMQLDDASVLRAVNSLRERELGWEVHAADARVPKYEENIEKKLGLTLQEVAALCVLFLRGPQTIGEIRGRTGRIYPFDTTEEVTFALEALMERDEPLVVKLPVQPGRKEARYMHTMCGEVDLSLYEAQATVYTPVAGPTRDAEIERLEARIEELESTVQGLRDEFATFRAEFE